jgi:hypothetical protein
VEGKKTNKSAWLPSCRLDPDDLVVIRRAWELAGGIRFSAWIRQLVLTSSQTAVDDHDHSRTGRAGPPARPGDGRRRGIDSVD